MANSLVIVPSLPIIISLTFVSSQVSCAPPDSIHVNFANPIPYLNIKNTPFVRSNYYLDQVQVDQARSHGG